MNLRTSLRTFLGVKISIEIIFRVKKVAGNGEFQDGRQSYSIYHGIFNLRHEPIRRNL